MKSSPLALRGGRRSAGFTLIELLTVIAIIGILAAIIIPTVGKVRTSARKAQCSSNQRQLAMACIAFANDNRGSLPFTDYSATPYVRWMYQISTYVGRPGADPANTYTGRVTPIYHCPSDAARVDAFARNATGTWDAVSFMHMLPVQRTSRENGTLVKKLHQITELALHPILVDARVTSSGDYANNTKFANLTKGTEGFIHEDGANVAYYDGHVRYWQNPSWSKIRGFPDAP